MVCFFAVMVKPGRVNITFSNFNHASSSNYLPKMAPYLWERLLILSSLIAYVSSILELSRTSLENVVREGSIRRRMASSSIDINKDYRNNFWTGFVASNIFLGDLDSPDLACGEASLSSGVAVNHCKQQDNYWYKFQLEKDSCVGATIEYYDDASCSSFAGLSELDAYEDQCAQSGFEHDHAVFQSLRCTTAARPPAPPYAYVVQNYAGTGCNDPVVAYDAYAADQCLYMSNTQSLQVDCFVGATGTPTVRIFNNNACTGEAKETTDLLSQCLDSQDDDDHFMQPFLDPPLLEGAHDKAAKDLPLLDGAHDKAAKVAMGAGVRASAVASDDIQGTETSSTSISEDSGKISAAAVVSRSPSGVQGSSKQLGYVRGSGSGQRWYLATAAESSSSGSVSTLGACVAASDNDDDEDDHDGSLSAGAIVGIVLGAVAGAVLVVLLVFRALFGKLPGPGYGYGWWWRSSAAAGGAPALDTEISLLSLSDSSGGALDRFS